MSARQFVVLGTASQAPTRHRNHSSYALRWDEQLILFDPGEGTQRQCILAGVATARATAVCITHFHGDHCLGLPGVIQRRGLDNPHVGPHEGHHDHPAGSTGPGAQSPGPDEPGVPELPVFFPAESAAYFQRLRTSSIYDDDTSHVVGRPVVGDGDVTELGPSARLSARSLDHGVPTIGYRIDEPDGHRVDPDALAALGISGPDVGRLLRAGWLQTPGGVVTAEEVSLPRPGQSMAFVMDTRLCDGAVELADGVDLLVCESTFLHRDADLAHRYRHLTARQAATLAHEAGARRLVLTHFSSRYPDDEEFRTEAAAIHDDVVVARELATVDVPRRR